MPQTGKDIYKEDISERFFLDRIQEICQFRSCDGFDLRLRYTRQNALIGYVADQDFIPHGGFQDTVQNTVDVTDRFRG